MIDAQELMPYKFEIKYVNKLNQKIFCQCQDMNPNLWNE
jgi:hypothetical protein